MKGIQEIHRAETISYVLGQLRQAHKSETARVAIYTNQPYAAALESIARDRAFRLEQLIRAIEAGLYDQLDATEAETAILTATVAATDSGRSTEAFLNTLPGPVEYVDYAEAAAVREIEEEMALEAAGVERWEDL